MKTLPLAGIVAALLALPVPAQTTQDLNAGAAAQAGAAAATNDATAAANQAQYEIDRQAYVTALAQQQRAVDRTNTRFIRQQTAYADAMAVWRVQVDQCKKGRQKACELPPPNPADYY